jgi:hypothetical protein
MELGSYSKTLVYCTMHNICEYQMYSNLGPSFFSWKSAQTQETFQKLFSGLKMN